MSHELDSDRSALLRASGETVRAIESALGELAPAVALLGLEPLDGREWYRSLREKLVPQIGDDAYLVVAVVGGTNIGKSVIFNHIADRRLSATSPLASGTRHPICAVPSGFVEAHDLDAIFPGFELRHWTSAEDALADSSEDRIFWRTVAQTPPNLLILDTPDIDSDAQVNWRRADAIRRTADVLIAVLTQQKYNDAAVKRYFRKAADEGKIVLVVFNQCQLPDDESYWPLWLGTFCRETGIAPRLVYVAPYDRPAAEEGRLAFHEKTRRSAGEFGAGDVRAIGASAGDAGVVDSVTGGASSFGGGDAAAVRACNLADDLSQLKFAEIKLSSLAGSLGHLMDARSGLPAFLDEIEGRSAAYESAARWLSTESVIRVRNWPSVPNSLFVSEVRSWWRERQHGMARRVHAFYDAVGRGLTRPFQMVGTRLRGAVVSPLDQYRRAEWGSVLSVIEEVFDKLTWLSESSNHLLKPYLDRMLTGRSRAQLVEQLKADHNRVDFAGELKRAVASEMRAFEEGSPELYRFYRQLNNLSAAVRPLTSVVLFTIGWGPAGHMLSPMLAPLVDMGTHSVVPIIADFAGGTAAAVAGDTAIAGGAGLLEARFRKLQTAFTRRRVDWLLGHFKDKLFGTIPQELQQAARVPHSDAFVCLSQATARLAKQVDDISAQTALSTVRP